MIPNIEARKFKEDITMGMVVQHNMNALNAYNKLNTNVAGLKKSSEKLSSGYRINRAGDDAAGLAISEKMRSQIRGLTQAKRNSQDGISMIQTFEGATNESHSILQRMKELASESANGTYQNEVDRDAIQLEFNQLNDELDQIADTDFNGVVMLNGGEMADGVKAVNGKFDYQNYTRNAIQLDSSYVTKLDTQAFDTGANANTIWADIFTNVDRTNTSTLDDGPESFEVTLKYDANAKTDDKTWSLSDATSGVDQTKITVAGTKNGGFTLTAGGVKFANAVIDQTSLKDGDTITLKFTNPVSKVSAPSNAGAVLTGGSLTTIGTDANALKKAEDADLTVAIPTTITADKMTQDLKNRYDALEGAKIDVTYAADGTETYTVAGVAITGTATDNSTPVTINGTAFTAFVDGGKLTIQDKDNGTALLEITAKDQTSTADGSVGTLSYTVGFEKAQFGTDKLPSAEVVDPAAKVSKANSNGTATAPLTYSDHMVLQTGSRTKDSVDFTFKYSTDGMGDLKSNLNLSSRADGLNTKNLSLATQEDANTAIDKIDNAINKVSMVRATFGATQNRLEHKIENLTTNTENLTEAESTIRDTDMASEMLNYTKYNVLQQAAQSMLAQANQQPQSILQLLG